MNGKNKINLYTKDRGYFTRVRYDIIELIPGQKNKILEIGCGSGATLYVLKKKGVARYVAGVDMIQLEQSNLLDKFICCDVEESIGSLPFSKEFFDIIICADVLEHLINPWEVLRKLKNYLKPNGYIVASIPNIREIRTLFSIFLKGDFRYQDAGILDKTHLRFFCKKNIVELFHGSGYKIEKITFNLSKKRNWLYRLSFGLLEEFLVGQYLILAKK